MALPGVNSVPEPEQNPIKKQTEGNDQKDSKFSIFDTNQDGTVTVAEQQEALREAVKSDPTIQEAVKKGFEPNIDMLGEIFEDIKTNVSKTFGKLIVAPQQMVAYANSIVQNLINHIKEEAKSFLQEKSQKSALTNLGNNKD